MTPPHYLTFVIPRNTLQWSVVPVHADELIEVAFADPDLPAEPVVGEGAALCPAAHGLGRAADILGGFTDRIQTRQDGMGTSRNVSTIMRQPV